MCMVSAVMDHGHDQWPDLIKAWPQPGMPGIPLTPHVPAAPDYGIRKIDLGGVEKKKLDDAREEGRKAGLAEPRLPTKEEIEHFLKLVKAAEAYDAATGQPHCEDPEKIKLLDAIERRLAAIEEKLTIESDDPHLYGSSNLPSHIGINEKQVQLGEVVLRAQQDSGLSARAWNALTEREREHRLVDAIADMRKEPA